MTVVLVPVGRGRWSPMTIHWDERLRDELPLPIDLKRGDTVAVMGVVFRVVRVES